MKYTIMLLLLLTLISCGNSIENIDAKKLKTSCDCAHAAETIITERLDLQESVIGKEVEDIQNSDHKTRWGLMMKKQEEVLKVCNGKLEFNLCPEWKTIKKKLMDRGNAINKKIQEESMKSSKN
ncbi:MAG: hypothetical protein RLZ10_1255 [Bacteroidota bacterium]|jgi:hypothetical protein